MLLSCTPVLLYVLLFALASRSGVSGSPSPASNARQLDHLIKRKAGPQHFQEFFSNRPELSEKAVREALNMLAWRIKDETNHQSTWHLRARYTQAAEVVTRYFFTAESEQHLICAVFHGNLETIERLATDNVSALSQNACDQALYLAELLCDTTAILLLTNPNSQLTFSAEASDEALYHAVHYSSTGNVQALSSLGSKLDFTEKGIYLALNLADTHVRRENWDGKLNEDIEIVEVLLDRFFRGEEQALISEMLAGNIKAVHDLIANQAGFGERASSVALRLALNNQWTDTAEALIGSKRKMAFTQKAIDEALLDICRFRFEKADALIWGLISIDRTFTFSQETNDEVLKYVAHRAYQHNEQARNICAKTFELLISLESNYTFGTGAYLVALECAAGNNDSAAVQKLTSTTRSSPFFTETSDQVLKRAVEKGDSIVVQALIGRDSKLDFTIQASDEVLVQAWQEASNAAFVQRSGWDSDAVEALVVKALVDKRNKLVFSEQACHEVFDSAVYESNIPVIEAFVESHFYLHLNEYVCGRALFSAIRRSLRVFQALAGRKSNLDFSDDTKQQVLRTLTQHIQRPDFSEEAKARSNEAFNVLVDRFFNTEEQILVRSVLRDSVESVQTLITSDNKFGPMARDQTLTAAIIMGDNQMVQMLVASSNFTFSEQARDYALLEAIQSSHVEIIEILVGIHSNLTFKEKDILKALDNTSLYFNIEAFQALIGNNSKLIMSEVLLERLLSEALHHVFCNTRRNRAFYMRKVDFLLGRLFRVEDEPLPRAALNEDPRTLKNLGIEQGGIFTQKAYDGAFSIASIMNHSEIVRHLVRIKHNFSEDVCGKALLLASERRATPMIEALISTESRLNFAEELVGKAIDSAVESTRIFAEEHDRMISQSIVRMLVERFFRDADRALVRAAFSEETTALQAVIMTGMSFNQSACDRALLMATVRDNVLMVQALADFHNTLTFSGTACDAAFKFAAQHCSPGLYSVLLNEHGRKLAFSDDATKTAKRSLEQRGLAI